MKRKILVGDTDETTEYLFPRMYKHFFLFDFVSSEAELINKAESFAYDAILTRINVKEGFHPYDIIEAVRNISHHRNTPLIAFTAHPVEFIRDLFGADKFNYLLPRPLSYEDMEELFRFVYEIGETGDSEESRKIKE